MIRSKVCFFLAAATTTILLAGCSSSKQADLCPAAAALVEASTLTAFPLGVPTDPSHALYRVAVNNVTTDCSIDKRERTADSSLDIHFVATRSPTGEAAQYRVPYFVAVRQGPDILAKKVFWAAIAFAPGEASIAFDESVDSTVVKIANDKQPYDYQILTGLQLTHDQLEYNRKTGSYGP